MGQKVHPESMRVGYIHDWQSNWFNERHFAEFLHEDIKIREHIIGKLAHAGLSDITIKKDTNEVEVNIRALHGLIHDIGNEPGCHGFLLCSGAILSAGMSE